MYKILFSIALYAQISLGMERWENSPLPEDFLQKVAEQKKFKNYSFYWYLHHRTQPISAKQLYTFCEELAKRDDRLCQNEKMHTDDRCSLFAQAQRHLSCWWIHKQALAVAISQKQSQ